ncbi:uncharacterized protein LOC121257032 [Juglans microcarpa x Juglans regia]|uniref:uncharacterized protein LOC121257032 n=1 Tax=Juglans microcarpa x Juglans regia TaxID=2249226 RepID=UPI001B7DD5A2|nr:uncharacterized protein LOC121257032 [Juglans microcarpa x Juglans regia]
MGKSRSLPQSMSKADLKFEKKRQFYGKVRETVASLSAQKSIGKKKKLRSRQKKLKAYDLSSLSEFLPELKSQRQPTELKLNCKSRQKLILKEGKHLSMVLSHPAFQSDPLAAIHQHLQSTQPIVDEKPEKRSNKNGGKKRKGKKIKSIDGPQSMVV